MHWDMDTQTGNGTLEQEERERNTDRNMDRTGREGQRDRWTGTGHDRDRGTVTGIVRHGERNNDRGTAIGIVRHGQRNKDRHSDRDR